MSELHPTPNHAPTQGSPVSQPWLLVHPWPPVALYSCCKAMRWAEGTPGEALPEGEGEGLVDTEAPWDQEGEGENEGLSDPLGEGEGLSEGDREELADTEAP